jgi:outer membrane protein OmpA-like peptidoglycan-associated protein
MRARFLIAIAAVLCITAAKAQTFEQDTDRPGNDIAQTVSANPQECRALCIDNALCAAFTFVPQEPGRGACWLKDVVPEPYFASGMVSGLVTAADRQASRPAPAAPQPASAVAGGALACQQLVSTVMETGRVALEGVHFDFNRATLRPDSLPALIAARDAIRMLGGEWTVEGHTDNIGGRDYNQELSLMRARAVAEWLQAAGTGSATLVAQGFSFDRPVADNATEEGRARNRRVELVAHNPDADMVGFGGPADVEPEDCAATVASASASSTGSGAAAEGADAGAVPGFDREAGLEWMPHAYLMGSGRTEGPAGASFEVESMGTTGTPQMCQSMCLSDAGCMAWSFEPPGSFFVEEGRCHRWGSQAELNLQRGGSEPFFAGIKPEATVLAEGSAEILAELVADEAEIARYTALTFIQAPAEVRPGEAFGIRVQGPALEGDWVEIAEFGDRRLEGGREWVYAEGTDLSGGVTLEINAPDEGDYVLRYVVEHPRAQRRVLAEVPLRVTPMAAPATMRPATTAPPQTPAPAIMQPDEGAGEDTGYYCPADALPCAYEDAETGLAFMVLPGFHVDFPYFYETAGGVRADQPSTTLWRTRDGEAVAVLNPRQWPADLGPCLDTQAGQACLYAPEGTDATDPDAQMAYGVFAGSLALSRPDDRAAVTPPPAAPEPESEIAATPPEGEEGDFMTVFMRESGIGAMIEEQIGDDPEAAAIARALFGTVGGQNTGQRDGAASTQAANRGEPPAAMRQLAGRPVDVGDMSAEDVLSIVVPRWAETVR